MRSALRGRLWSPLGIKNAQRQREGETQIRLAKVPAGQLFNALDAIRGGVAVHAERTARLCGAWCVQNGAQGGDALLPCGGGAIKERLEQRQRLTATIWNGGDGTKKSMCGEEIGRASCRERVSSPV